jgi:hypothetical protein
MKTILAAILATVFAMPAFSEANCETKVKRSPYYFFSKFEMTKNQFGVGAAYMVMLDREVEAMCEVVENRPRKSLYWSKVAQKSEEELRSIYKDWVEGF